MKKNLPHWLASDHRPAPRLRRFWRWSDCRRWRAGRGEV